MNELSSWGYHWSEPGGVTWNEYLRQQNIVNAINGGSASAAAGLARCMASNTRDIIGSVRCLERTLESTVSRAADQISATFSWGFGEILASLGGIQTTLEELLKLAKSPAVTAAYEQFEIARDAYRKGLYPECLESLNRAINGFEGSTAGYKLEWRFHYLRGLVLLGSYANADAALINSMEAEKCFLTAARYAKSDHPKDAAKALLSAGWAAYVQVDSANSQKLTDGLEHTQSAWKLDPGLGEAIFQKSKFEMALGKPDLALESLKRAVEFGAVYLVKAACDGDFHRHQEQLNQFVKNLLETKSAEIQKDITPIANEIDMWFDASEELSKNSAAQRVVSYGKNTKSKSLLELLDYHPNQWNKDRIELEALVFRANQLYETVVEKVPTGEVDQVELIEHETYWEEEVRPGGWFRKEVRTKVQKTRPKMVVKEIPRMMEVRNRVFIKNKSSSNFTVLNGLCSKSILLEKMTVFKVYDAFGIPVLFIPAGSFLMGSQEIESGRSEDESQHEVVLSQKFGIAQTPCTQKQWNMVFGSNPSQFKGADLPVENINWFEAKDYCIKLTAKQRTEGLLPNGWEWRLPTEAEWEYAARAGTRSARYCSLNTAAWYSGNSGETHNVKQKAANAWGLYDMLGNVTEWCVDWYGDYPLGPVTDPIGPISGSARVCRGGSWVVEAKDARSASREGRDPSSRFPDQGFRPVLSAVR